MTRLTGFGAYADGMLTASRVRRWTATTLGLQLVVAGFLVLAAHGYVVSLTRPNTTDFVSFYAAGLLANGAESANTYNHVLHYLTEQAVVGAGIPHIPFFYPPVFLLACGLLAHLPYLVAFVTLEVSTTAACVLVVQAIAEAPLLGSALATLSFSPSIWNAGFGQNACLTASLFGLGTLLLSRRRQVAAGLVLACLFYKPHTGLLIPIALAAGGLWRCFFAAGLGTCILALASVVAFGTESWAAFLHLIVIAQKGFAAGQIVPFFTTASVFGACRLLGMPLVAARCVQALVTILVITSIVRAWRARTDRDEAKYAMLTAGTILVMPVVLFYDTVLLVVSAAWLLRAAQRSVTLPGERACLGAIWLAGLSCYPVSRAAHVPIADAMACATFFLAVMRDLQLRGCLRNRKRTPS